MPTKADVIKSLDWVTERISNRVWTISVGVLATALAFIIESTKNDGTPFLLPRQVAGPAAVALLALVSDLIQYIAANAQDTALLRKMETDGVIELSYDQNSSAYRVRKFAYWANIALCLGCAVWIAGLSAVRVISLL